MATAPAAGGGRAPSPAVWPWRARGVVGGASREGIARCVAHWLAAALWRGPERTGMPDRLALCSSSSARPGAGARGPGDAPARRSWLPARPGPAGGGAAIRGLGARLGGGGGGAGGGVVVLRPCYVPILSDPLAPVRLRVSYCVVHDKLGFSGSRRQHLQSQNASCSSASVARNANRPAIVFDIKAISRVHNGDPWLVPYFLCLGISLSY